MRRAAALLTLPLLAAAIAGDLHAATAARTADPWVFPMLVSGAVTDPPGISVAQATTTDEQRQREQYIQRALQAPAVPAIAGRKERSTGTAFYVADHVLLTNYHVVRECPVLTIQSGEDGVEPAVAAVSAADQADDLALLRSKAAGDAAAALEAALDHVDGSDLSVVGYPLHGLVVRKPTITAAQANPDALKSSGELFQFRADVHPGQSGSPLLDEYGAVVGVVARKVDSVATYQKSGRLVTDVGFAIPNRTILAFLQAQHVHYRVAIPNGSLSPAERLEKGRAFVARVSCWS